LEFVTTPGASFSADLSGEARPTSGEFRMCLPVAHFLEAPIFLAVRISPNHAFEVKFNSLIGRDTFNRMLQIDAAISAARPQ
jgi:hypothetical protein